MDIPILWKMKPLFYIYPLVFGVCAVWEMTLILNTANFWIRGRGRTKSPRLDITEYFISAEQLLNSVATQPPLSQPSVSPPSRPLASFLFLSFAPPSVHSNSGPNAVQNATETKQSRQVMTGLKKKKKEKDDEPLKLCFMQVLDYWMYFIATRSQSNLVLTWPSEKTKDGGGQKKQDWCSIWRSSDFRHLRIRHHSLIRNLITNSKVNGL